MKSFRIVTLGCLASFVLGAALVAACTDSDTVITTPDGGGDSATTPPTPGPTDAGSDADATVTTVPDFVALIEHSFCSALTRCCFDDPNLADGGDAGGAGTYNGDECAKLVHNIGFEFSSVGAELLDGGTVTIDGPKAQQCADQLSALACDLSGTSLSSARAACFDAFVGHVDVGHTCVASIECGPGHFCEPTTQKCAPLRGDGGVCQVYDISDAGTKYERDIANSSRDEEACSTRGGGDTHLRCNSYDPTIGDYRDGGPWTCAPTVPINEGCNSTVWCENGICDITNDDFICRSPVDYFNGANRACSAVVQ